MFWQHFNPWYFVLMTECLEWLINSTDTLVKILRIKSRLYDFYLQIFYLQILTFNLKNRMHTDFSHVSNWNDNEENNFILYSSISFRFGGWSQFDFVHKYSVASQETDWNITQESIPVGCVPPACWIYPVVSHVSRAGGGVSTHSQAVGTHLPGNGYSPCPLGWVLTSRGFNSALGINTHSQGGYSPPPCGYLPPPGVGTHPLRLWTDTPLSRFRAVKTAGSSQIIICVFLLFPFFITVLFWMETTLRNNRDQQTKECCMH